MAACAAPAPTDSLDPSLDGVTLNPGSAALVAGDSVGFEALGHMTDGSTSAIPVVWSATGGTVSAGGVYHAGGTPGTYRVVATVPSGGHADTAQVEVTAAVSLTSLTVAPGLDTLVPGSGRTYSVSGQYSDGIPRPVSVTWSATGGTVTSGGVYTAGSTEGTFRVIATASGGVVADTATVVIKTPTVVLTSIDVTPALDTLVPSATRTFMATGHYSDGSSGNVSVTWSATGGSVTQGGVYTAGGTLGTNFRVIATATAAAVADTARVVIKAPPVTLTGVVVTPALDTLAPAASRTFTATGQYSDGSSGSVSVTWSATGGAITQGGVYTAGATQGTFRVIGLNAAAGKADTSTVVIKTATPTLTAVVVNPASITLDPGESQAFSVAGQFSDGSSGPVTVTWTATGGTVSSSGLYTAGAAAGTFRVIATATIAARADTSAITIRDTTTPPPTGTVLLSEAFDNSSAGARGWYANESPTISTAEKHSGAGSLQMAWQANTDIPVNGVSLRHLFTATDRIYLRYWVKYSTNFVGSQLTYHPHEIQFLTDKDDMWIGPSATHLTAYVEHNWQNGGIPRLALTDVLNVDQSKIGVDLTNVTEQRAVAGCNGNSDGYPTGCYPFGAEHYNEKVWLGSQPVFTNTPGSPGYKNEWHKVEVYYQMNTIVGGKGQNNGVAQYWFDGQLKIDLHNVLLRTGANATMKFNQILLAFYIGDLSPVAQTVWIDDLVVATGPVP